MNEMKIKVKILPIHLDGFKAVIAKAGFSEHLFQLPVYNSEVEGNVIDGIPRMDIKFLPEPGFYFRFNQIGDSMYGERPAEIVLNDIILEYIPGLGQEIVAERIQSYEALKQQFGFWVKALKQNTASMDLEKWILQKTGYRKSVDLTQAFRFNTPIEVVLGYIKECAVPTVRYDSLLYYIKESQCIPILPIHEPVKDAYIKIELDKMLKHLININFIELINGEYEPTAKGEEYIKKLYAGEKVTMQKSGSTSNENTGERKKLVLVRTLTEGALLKGTPPVTKAERKNPTLYILKVIKEFGPDWHYDSLLHAVTEVDLFPVPEFHREVSQRYIKGELDRFLSHMERQHLLENKDENTLSVSVDGDKYLKKGGKSKSPFYEWKFWTIISSIILFFTTVLDWFGFKTGIVELFHKWFSANPG